MVRIILGDLECAVFCFILGFLIKSVYDLVKIAYLFNKKSKVTHYLGDTIFFTFIAFAVFQIMLERYNGVIRGFSLFFMSLGAIIHRLIICDTFVNTIEKMVFYIDSKIVRKCRCFFVKIIRKVCIFKRVRAMLLKFNHRCSTMFLRSNSKKGKV